MDQQSVQPILGKEPSRVKLEVVDVETQNKKNRKPSLLKTSPNKWLILAIVLLSLLCIIFFITICVLATEEEDTCLTPQCLRSASNFLDSMDTSVEPCNNFYNFVCGRWNREHIIRQHYISNDWFLERAWIVEKDTIDFLSEEDKPEEPETVKKARTLYRSCIDFDAMEEHGWDTVSDFMDSPDKLGIGFLPPSPLTPWSMNVTYALAKIKRMLDLDIFFGLTWSRVQTNNTIQKLAIASPFPHIFSKSLKSKVANAARTRRPRDNDEYYSDDERDDKIVDPDANYHWKTEVGKFIENMYAVADSDIVPSRARMDGVTTKLMLMRDAISQIENMEKVKDDPTDNDPIEMTIYELQKLVDNVTLSKQSRLRFLEYFDYMFNEEKLMEYLKSNQTILVYNIVHLQEISKYLDGLDDYKIDLWLWWNVVYTLGPHIDKYALNLIKSIDATDDITSSKTREVICSDLVISLMRNTASYLIMRQPNSEVIRAKVREMIKYVKEEFESLINTITWMDEQTKVKTLEKLHAMRDIVAYPEERKNLSYLNSDYEYLEFNETTHLQNFLDILWDMNDVSLDDLNEPVEQTKGSTFDSLDTNAYYISNENAIYVPGGILQFPFYDLGLEALNYGAIGTIIGHEITHGFDSEGRKYDKDGNKFQWWSEKSDDEYQKRLPCYINDYGSFYIESINQTVDGNLTLAENIADIGGLLEAFRAYQQYVADNGPEKKLPGFEDYTSEQLFFLSYAMTWCSEYTEESLLDSMDDAHSPDFVRTLRSLSNSPDFAKVWKCPKGSNMNPNKEKCQLWVD